MDEVYYILGAARRGKIPRSIMGSTGDSLEHRITRRLEDHEDTSTVYSSSFVPHHRAPADASRDLSERRTEDDDAPAESQSRGICRGDSKYFHSHAVPLSGMGITTRSATSSLTAAARDPPS